MAGRALNFGLLILDCIYQIERFGYKIVMSMDMLILVIVCFFYGFAHHIFPMRTAFIVCCVNYTLD